MRMWMWLSLICVVSIASGSPWPFNRPGDEAPKKRVLTPKDEKFDAGVVAQFGVLPNEPRAPRQGNADYSIRKQEYDSVVVPIKKAYLNLATKLATDKKATQSVKRALEAIVKSTNRAHYQVECVEGVFAIAIIPTFLSAETEIFELAHHRFEMDLVNEGKGVFSARSSRAGAGKKYFEESVSQATSASPLSYEGLFRPNESSPTSIFQRLLSSWDRVWKTERVDFEVYPLSVPASDKAEIAVVFEVQETTTLKPDESDKLVLPNLDEHHYDRQTEIMCFK